MKNLYFMVILFLSMSIYGQNTIQKTTYGGRINVGGGLQANGSDGLELSFTGNGNFQIRYKSFYQIYSPSALDINTSFITARSNIYSIVFGYLNTAATGNPRGSFRSSSAAIAPGGGTNLGNFTPTSFDVFKDPTDLTGNTSIFEANYNLIIDGITYQYKLQYVYTYPKKNFSMRHTVTIPSNNPSQRRIRIGHFWDTYLNGNDSGPGLAIETPTYLSVQVKRGDIFQGIIHESGVKWNGYYSAEYNQLPNYLGSDQGTFLAYDSKRINPTNVDNGLGYSMDFGNLPGTYTSSALLSFQCNAPATVPVLTPVGGTIISCGETTKNITYNGTIPFVDEDNNGVNDIRVKYVNVLTNQEIFPSQNGQVLVPEGIYEASFLDTANLCQSNSSTITIVKYKNCNIDTNDSDGDGVLNYLDLDHDNDGIFNDVESPNCFYSATEVNVIQEITSNVNGSTTQTAAGNELASLHNGTTTGDSPAFNFTAGQTIPSGRVLFSIDYPGAFVMRTMTVTQAANAMAQGTQYGQLFGSNDGVNFVSISAGALLSTATVTFTSNTTTPYRYYQIRYVGTTAVGNSASTVVGTAPIYEITSTISTTVAYVSSSNIKPGTCSDDTDGDGIPDYLDLDSDNDGCADAVEGSARLPASNLVTAAAGLTGGTGSTVEENLCANGSCINQSGVPSIIAAGQDIGNSKNASLGCFCYKPAKIASGAVLDASVGISSLGRKDRNSDGWPVVRKGAWLALESKSKGFVLNRIATTALVNAIPTPIEGMMVYDEEANCIKIYTTTNNVDYSWKCYDTQTCPDF